MKRITKTVYVDDNGVEHDTPEAARKGDAENWAYRVLANVPIDWRDTGPLDLARALAEAGYKIVAVGTEAEN